MPPKNYINKEEVETIVIIPPDGGWGWVVVFVAFLNNFVIDGIGYTYGLYIKVISEEFNIGDADTAMIGALMSATSYFCGPFVSALLNKYDTRCVSISGAILAACAYVICSFTSEYYVLLSAYGIMLGCGFGMMYMPAIIMPTLYFARWRALASGIGVSGSGLGTLVVPPIVTPLLNKLGWRNTFRCIICVVLFAGFLTLAYIPLRPTVASNREQVKDLNFDPSKRKSKINFQDLPKERNCCQRCFSCKHYQNKAYPTTTELINPKTADLNKDKLTAASRKATNYFGGDSNSDIFFGRKSLGFVGMRQSRYVAAISEFTCSEICKYNCLVCLYSECCEQDAKPMYRDDIFFTNSIKLIPKYKRTAMRMQKKIKDKEKEKTKQRLDKVVQDARDKENREELLKNYHMSVTRVTVYQEYIDRPKCRCHMSILRALSTLLHLELFKSITFLITGFAGLLYIFGYNIPFMFIVKRAETEGIKQELTFWFLAVVGGANTFGRLMSGILPSVTTLNVIVLTWVPAFICGASTICSGLLMKPWFQFMSAAIFGFFGAFTPALRPVLIVNLFGLENLTNVFGLQLLLSGFAAFFGPTIAGMLYDTTKKYDYSFYLSGGCIILSGAMYICITRIRKWEVGDESDDEEYNYESEAGPA